MDAANLTGVVEAACKAINTKHPPQIVAILRYTSDPDIVGLLETTLGSGYSCIHRQRECPFLTVGEDQEGWDESNIIKTLTTLGERTSTLTARIYPPGWHCPNPTLRDFVANHRDVVFADLQSRTEIFYALNSLRNQKHVRCVLVVSAGFPVEADVFKTQIENDGVPLFDARGLIDRLDALKLNDE